MGVNGLSVQRYGCEGETSRNCLHHARTAASEPYQPPDFLPTCGDPTPRVALLSVTWVRCAIFLEEIARHKLFRLISWRKSLVTNFFRLISSGNRSPQTFSAHFLRKSLATKLFRLISSGNRPPQTFSAHFLRKSAATNYFGSFPQEIGRHKTISAHFLRKSAATNYFGSFPQEIAGMGFHSFPQEIAGMAHIELTLFLRRTHVSVDAHGKVPF